MNIEGLGESLVDSVVDGRFVLIRDVYALTGGRPGRASSGWAGSPPPTPSARSTRAAKAGSATRVYALGIRHVGERGGASRRRLRLDDRPSAVASHGAAAGGARRRPRRRSIGAVPSPEPRPPTRSRRAPRRLAGVDPHAGGGGGPRPAVRPDVGHHRHPRQHDPRRRPAPRWSGSARRCPVGQQEDDGAAAPATTPAASWSKRTPVGARLRGRSSAT